MSRIISELIYELETIRDYHGDLPITIRDTTGKLYLPTIKVEVTEKVVGVKNGGRIEVYAAVGQDYPQHDKIACIIRQ